MNSNPVHSASSDDQRINKSVRGESNVKKSALCAALLASMAGAGFTTAAFAADDTSLTWNGITFYGVVDVGIAYQEHGTPLSQDFYPGLEYLISKNSNKSISSVAPNGLSQTKFGVRGKEAINDELYGIFNAEMGWEPQSGRLADACASLVHNNGVPQASQTSAADGSRCGQFFNGVAYLGLQSKDWGTATLGRNNSLLLDTINKNDPMGGSYAFSLIGYSGATAGGGNTENTRLDNSLKYNIKFDAFRGGLLYQWGKTDSSPGEAWQANIGFDYAGFSIDGTYAYKKDAIAAASLSAAQLLLPGVPADSLAATISDNEAWNISGSYAWENWKFFAGYEHITYKNPSLPIEAPFSGLGGYYLSILNNAAYTHHKELEPAWLGARWSISPQWDLTGAWYHYDQNSYKGNGCSDASAGSCSGNEDVYSVMTDYHWTKRFDTYAGIAWSKVSDGLASGFLHTSTYDPMIGARFSF
jgi:predicted porin